MKLFKSKLSFHIFKKSFRGIKAEDPDSGPRGLVQYRIIPGKVSVITGKEKTLDYKIFWFRKF